MDLLTLPYEQVSVPEAIRLPAVNTPSAFTAPTSSDTLHLKQESAAPIVCPRWYASASTLTVWFGLTEIELSALPPLCSAIESTPVVMHTFIEPETAPFEPVMVARPALLPAVKVWPETVPSSSFTV